jgi:hypothetical protein
MVQSHMKSQGFWDFAKLRVPLESMFCLMNLRRLVRMSNRKVYMILENIYIRVIEVDIFLKAK